MRCNVKRVVLPLLLFASASGAFAPGQDHGVFLQRPGTKAYRNYAEYSYRNYRSALRVNPRYNFLGDFLAEGFRAFRLDDQRPGRSLLSKDGVYRGMFNNLLIARNSYGRLNLALTVGDEVRTHLTPLTMQRAGFNGLRWEIEFANNRVTLLSTRGFDNSEFPAFPSFSTPISTDFTGFGGDLNQEFIIEEDDPVYIFGGHWETQAGDVLTLGMTFLNQQQINTGALRQDSFLAGSVPYPEMLSPQKLMLRVTDDSPRSRDHGATIFTVFLEVEGSVGGVNTTISSDPRSPHFDESLRPQTEGVRKENGRWDIRGDEELIITFELPEGSTSRRARFIVAAANDYRIAAGQQHLFYMTLSSRKTPFTTLRRAAGDVSDGSNSRELVIDYGLNSGQTLYGVDFAADLVGLELRGEVAKNILYRKYPIISGRSLRRDTGAWYLQAVRTFPRLRRLSLGAEFFHLGPRYGGGYDSRRGGVVLYTDFGGEGTDPVAAEFPLVDDNDDDDRYSDDNKNDFPGSFDLEAGVYPGLDEDNDNIPDDDRNANGIPDFEEPFLLYHSDPQEFVYGLDLNNNGVIDVRENDDKPDYPYDRDRRGRHYTAALQPLPKLKVGAGHYRIRALAGPGRTVSTYLRAAYVYARPERLEIELNHDSKRVKDTIPDPVYVFDPARLVTPLEPPDPDPLLQKNSWVHTSFAGVRLSRWAPLHLETNLKQVDNRMFDLGRTRVSERDRRVTRTMVNKADYRIEWGRFTVRPMYKRLWRRVDLDSRDGAAVREVRSAPMLRVDYEVTEDMKVQMGQQGLRLPFAGLDRVLAFHLNDRVRRYRSYTSTDFMFMLTLKGSYLGNALTATSGVQLHSREFDQVGAGEDLRFTRFFVDVVAGFEH